MDEMAFIKDNVEIILLRIDSVLMSPHTLSNTEIRKMLNNRFSSAKSRINKYNRYDLTEIHTI